MKNLIYQIFVRTLTQILNFERFSVAYRSFAFALTFPIVLNSPLPISLPVAKLENQKPKLTETRAEKLVNIAFDSKNPEALVLAEKQVKITLSESNFDMEQKLAFEQAEKAAQETQKLAKRNVIVRERPRYTSDPDLSQKRALAQSAAFRYGIDWRILEAVWQVESGKSWDTNKRSYAGATGPMQFMGGTWRRYAVDANGDGRAEITSAHDSVYGAANLLAASGASSGQVDRALYAYNHSYSYVKKVLKIARELGY